MTTPRPPVRPDGFSLVEVTVAIGIFAFVIVGIIGLFPTALKIRAESALETRSSMIAQQLFSQVRSSTSISNVVVRDGPAFTGTITANLLTSVIVMGYQSRTTMPYWLYRTSPGAAWTNTGGADADVIKSAQNDINTLARLSATAVPGAKNLYQVNVDIRSPASLPLANTKPANFSTFVYLP